MGKTWGRLTVPNNMDMADQTNNPVKSPFEVVELTIQNQIKEIKNRPWWRKKTLSVKDLQSQITVARKLDVEWHMKQKENEGFED